MLKQFAIALLAIGSTGAAYAASDDAWEEFRQEVEQGCIAATATMLTNSAAIVDPFGSETYGFAIVTGETPAGTTASTICVFDKQTKSFEIGGELAIAVTPVEAAE
jgi:hypothetical protein